MQWRRGSIIVALAASLAAAGLAAAPAGATIDYKGKQITIVIGYGVGGTYYQYAQLFSRHLGRMLPGQPGVIVQSMPGAGGVRMLNEAAVRMRADGSFILMPPDTTVVAQLLSARGSIAFDARRFHYIGTADQQNMFWVVRRSTAADLVGVRAKETFIGSSGKGSTGHLIGGVVRGLLGLKVRLVGGYEGSRDTILAMEKGEIDGAVQGWQVWMQARPDWLAPGGFAAPILQVGLTPDPAAPGVPLLGGLVAPEDRGIVALFDTIGVIGRGLALPPDTPSDYVAALRQAVAAMLSDDDYRADSAKVQLRILPKSGAEVAQAIAAALDGATDAVKARAASFLE